LDTNKSTLKNTKQRKKKMAQCVTCGAGLKPGELRCVKCGTSVEVQPAAPQAFQTPQQPQIVYVQQPPQPQNLPVDKDEKPKGAIGWLIFWILIFWPAAIVYALTRKWK
jgi:hypothetical protein